MPGQCAELLDLVVDVVEVGRGHGFVVSDAETVELGEEVGIRSVGDDQVGLDPAIASTFGSKPLRPCIFDAASSGKFERSSTARTWSPAPMANSISVAVGDSDMIADGTDSIAAAASLSEPSVWSRPWACRGRRSWSDSSLDAFGVRITAAGSDDERQADDDADRSASRTWIFPPLGEDKRSPAESACLPPLPRGSGLLTRHRSTGLARIETSSRRFTRTTVAGQRRDLTGLRTMT